MSIVGASGLSTYLFVRKIIKKKIKLIDIYIKQGATRNQAERL